MENCHTLMSPLSNVHLLPGDEGVQEDQVVVVGTGYFRNLADGALNCGPFDVVVEPIEELLDGDDLIRGVKSHAQAVISVDLEQLHVSGECPLGGRDHGAQQVGHG